MYQLLIMQAIITYVLNYVEIYKLTFVRSIINFMALCSTYISRIVTDHDCSVKIKNIESRIQNIEIQTGRKIIFFVDEINNISYPKKYVYILNSMDTDNFIKYYQTIKNDPIDFILYGFGGSSYISSKIISCIHNHYNSRAIIPIYAHSTFTILALALNSILMNNNSTLSPIDTQRLYQINSNEDNYYSVNVLVNDKYKLLVDSKYKKKYDRIISKKSILDKEDDINSIMQYVSHEQHIIDVFCNKYSHNRIFNKQYLIELGVNKISGCDIPQVLLDLFYDVIL
jgi:hypothetical protein